VYYFGYVVCRVDDSWKVKCMRRHHNRLTSFPFPIQENIGLYSVDVIVKVLKVDIVVRNVYNFLQYDLAPYFHALR
jgi:hypothetical protein